MIFSKNGDALVVGDEPVLAPGVRGTAFDTDEGIYIPLVIADVEGSGDVGRFLDALPTDRRLVFPNVMSERLAGMLLRRGFWACVEHTGVERADGGELLEVFQRCPR